MKRIVAIILTIALAASTFACGVEENSQPELSETTSTGKVARITDESKEDALKDTSDVKTLIEEKSSASEDGQLEEDMKELSAIGDVEVENGLLIVTITVPSELAGEISQEELEQNKGDTYTSATLNEDGSVTYKMTKTQYKEMLNSISESLDKSFQKLVDDENCSISSVTHNDDYTVFDVIVEGTELSFTDAFTVYAFYMSGGLYGIFTGQEPEHIIVNFYDPDGNPLESGDSANMEN